MNLEITSAKSSLKSKISLAIACGLLLAVVAYHLFVFFARTPLREHLNGKWANMFESFSFDTKERVITYWGVGVEPVKREYEIVSENRWDITLDVMGEKYAITFDKKQPERKKMMLSKDGAPAEEYILVLPGEKDPSIHERIIDDPDEKLRDINRRRRKGEM